MAAATSATAMPSACSVLPIHAAGAGNATAPSGACDDTVRTARRCSAPASSRPPRRTCRATRRRSRPLFSASWNGFLFTVLKVSPLSLSCALERGVERRHVGALLHGAFVEQALRRSRADPPAAAPRCAVRHHPEAFPHVAGERAELLHLVELRRVDQRERIFLPVDHLGLQRRIDLDEIDRGRRGAERAEHRGEQRAHRHAQLQALQVVRIVDRLVAGGDLAEAVVPHLVERHEADGADLLADMRAEIAVDRGPHAVEIRERERDARDRRDRNQRSRAASRR